MCIRDSGRPVSQRSAADPRDQTLDRRPRDARRADEIGVKIAGAVAVGVVGHRLDCGPGLAEPHRRLRHRADLHIDQRRAQIAHLSLIHICFRAVDVTLRFRGAASGVTIVDLPNEWGGFCLLYTSRCV